MVIIIPVDQNLYDMCRNGSELVLKIREDPYFWFDQVNWYDFRMLVGFPGFSLIASIDA